jgi:hypothetical protein
MKDEVKAKLALVYPPRRASGGSALSRSAAEATCGFFVHLN